MSERLTKPLARLAEAAERFADFKVAAEAGQYRGSPALAVADHKTVRAELESAARAYATSTRQRRKPRS